MKKQFIVTIEGDINEENNELGLTCKEAIEGAIENETQDNFEWPIYDCDFVVKEITEK